MKTDGDQIRSILGSDSRKNINGNQFEAFDISDEDLLCISEYPQLFDAQVRNYWSWHCKNQSEKLLEAEKMLQYPIRVPFKNFFDQVVTDFKERMKVRN